MTKHKGGPTINTGGASRPKAEERDAEFDIAGNAKLKGEDPSPGGRDRGETSSADEGACLDMDAAHDRAS
ncbi:MAG: hypothetical protein QOJ94_2537 [Sphingomonadales bacterium]|jgi:hypothetical protein|nr:hypothetical protein [Sphingomonadales bacterium]MEA3062756.1 hypothetical protein [Sphingomonadales bacterium]